jgi:hypothetical protein
MYLDVFALDLGNTYQHIKVTKKYRSNCVDRCKSITIFVRKYKLF